MVRLNITMPEDLAKQLGPIQNKSSFIAQALREKLQREQKVKLESQLVEAYKASAKEDRALRDDWDVTVSDGWK